ncbi:hypothetical protein K5V21_16065 [Clostridium sardiniense]|uniref:Uncharacterized protein n=1 Tax=Clostridium sardiniense TaxID=29369 RepID=A0ABS7L2A3_CLOSR|nr:hypothetical protein [Clostridium sardiniense]MBY0756937.1 hypothetical protein [Clostridium sardiniense]MBY0756961.1 hypothetical protein [Clostridium sardiniense]MDQ0460355.1 hypothetical protein [Clostridium sardiniense]
MKKFLWYNIEKLKTDIDYFSVSYISLIFIQLPLYSSFFRNINLFSDLVLGIISSSFFLYMTFTKKDFTLIDVFKNLFF